MPIPSLVALFEPFPMIRSPVVVIGDKALNPAATVVCPVPPYPIPTAVPFHTPLNVVALNTPVLGTKLSLVDDVVAPTFPVVADEMTG